MILSRRNHNNNNYLKVDEYKFERVQSFKYLGRGADINENANIIVTKKLKNDLWLQVNSAIV